MELDKFIQHIEGFGKKRVSVDLHTLTKAYSPESVDRERKDTFKNDAIEVNSDRGKEGTSGGRHRGEGNTGSSGEGGTE